MYTNKKIATCKNQSKYIYKKQGVVTTNSPVEPWIKVFIDEIYLDRLILLIKAALIT